MIQKKINTYDDLIKKRKDDLANDQQWVISCAFEKFRGLGLIFHVLFRDLVYWEPEHQQWLVRKNATLFWDKAEEVKARLSHVWEVLARVKGALKESIKALEQEKKDDQAKGLERTAATIQKRMDSLNTVSGRNQTLEFARTLDLPGRKNELVLEPGELDSNPVQRGTPTGAYYIDTGERIPTDRNIFPKISLRTGADPQDVYVDCPNFEKFIDEVLGGKEDVVEYIQRVLGMAMHTQGKEEIILNWIGQGRNGKTKLINVLRHVLGDYAATIKPELLLLTRGGGSTGPDPETLRLRAKTHIFGSETAENQRLNTTKLKSWVGQDCVTGRLCNSNHIIEFPFKGTIILATNNLPAAPAEDYAFWERVRVIEFPVSFVTREPTADNERPADLNIEQKLLQEADGILAWILRGGLKWQREGLQTPQAVLQATADYRRDQDILADFFEECCILEENFSVGATSLYEAFQEWYSVNISSRHVPAQKKFGNMLKKKNFEKKKKHGKYTYYGIGLEVSL